jgi:hypothetical protein
MIAQLKCLEIGGASVLAVGDTPLSSDREKPYRGVLKTKSTLEKYI